MEGDPQRVAHCIAMGQSIGNPDLRSEIEIMNVMEMAAEIISIEADIVTVRFNLKALIWPNFAQLLCIVMGGQSDIADVIRCRVVDIIGLPKVHSPNVGLRKFKERVGATNRPLVGTIIKPKSGLSSQQLCSIVDEMIDGGTDFIKEDEIMSENSYTPIAEGATLAN